MGGKSKKTTVGYKYYLGEHMTLAHGPVDALTRIRVDQRDAWNGYTTGGRISITANDLFGGESREGGVSGEIDIEMGEPTQGQNDYLVSQLGETVPAYRGVFAAVLRRCYLGNNPYLKAWDFRAQRIFKADRGELQWYPEKAAIASAATTVPTDVTLTWWQSSSVQGGAARDTAKMTMRFWSIDGESLGFHDSAEEPGPFYPEWEQRSITATAPAGTARVQLFQHMWRNSGASNDGYIDDIALTFNGHGVSVPNSSAERGTSGWTSVEGQLGYLETGGHQGPNFFFGGAPYIDYTAAYQDIPLGVVDMNPVHIIRECLINRIWGMGYGSADIDDDSFRAAADTIFAEGMGMSLLWDTEITIDEFIQEVVRHIDAALYVHPGTGLFTLKLIRADYDPEQLIRLDESNVSKVTNPSKSAFGELTNTVTVKYWDPATSDTASLMVDDPALVQQQGQVINATVQYPGFSNPRNASIAASRDLRALSIPFLTCTIYADSIAKDLNIGDTFRFSWARWQLVDSVMRVVSIAYGDGKTNVIRITCTQDVYATPLNPVIVPSAPAWVNPSAPPDPFDHTLAIEAPYFELVQVLGQADLDSTLSTKSDIGYALGAAPRANSAINGRMWTDSGAGYEDVDGLDFCPYAALAAPIGQTDTVLSIADGVDLDLVNVGTWCQIGEELMRVDEVDEGAGTMTVGRGVLDTVPQLHEAGAGIFFWDEFSGYDPTEYVEGEEIDVKLQPVSGAGVVGLGDIEPDTIVMAARAWRPYAPGDLRINGDSYADQVYGGELEISWVHRDRLQQTSAVLADHFDGSIGPEAGTTYRVRFYLDGVLVDEQDEIDGTEAVFGTPESGLMRVEVSAKRDGVYSWQAAHHEFIYTSFGALRVIEDGEDYRGVEDGSLRSTED